MKRSAVLVVVGFLAAFGAATLVQPQPRASPSREIVHRDMAASAIAFLESLTTDLRTKAQLKFDNPARLDWHFVPRTRPGVTLGELNDAQRNRVQALLRSALSSQGVLKTNAIIDLEHVLRDLENGNAGRDPGKYTVTIYGEPGSPDPTKPESTQSPKPWGWKIEGHHISLNFTSSGSLVTSVTPSFLGSNPATVPSGEKAGQRILAAEEDLGRSLVMMLSDEQRRVAIIAEMALPDVILGPGRGFDDAPAAGLVGSNMNVAQREALWAIVEEFAHNLRRELAESELQRIRGTDGRGIESIHFAWAGSLKPGEPHYYRLRGPTFVFEYDNTQNNANHIHTVWHDLTRDFASDPLKEHYENGHHGHEHK